jgi:hypothetical protein
MTSPFIKVAKKVKYAKDRHMERQINQGKGLKEIYARIKSKSGKLISKVMKAKDYALGALPKFFKGYKNVKKVAQLGNLMFQNYTNATGHKPKGKLTSELMDAFKHGQQFAKPIDTAMTIAESLAHGLATPFFPTPGAGLHKHPGLMYGNTDSSPSVSQNGDKAFMVPSMNKFAVNKQMISRPTNDEFTPDKKGEGIKAKRVRKNYKPKMARKSFGGNLMRGPIA